MFDENFLLERQRKQESWNKSGRRSGSGGAFRDLTDQWSTKGKKAQISTSKSNVGTKKDDAPKKQVQNSKVTQCEKNFNSFLNRIGDRMRQCLSIKQRGGRTAIMSVHAAALAMFRGSKNPYVEHFQSNAEHWEQVALFDRVHEHLIDVYPYMAAMPNGGYRTKKAAAMIKREGGKKGYPDILIDLPRGIYHGMRLEMKIKGGVLHAEQKDWLNRLHKQGYFVAVAWSVEEAYELIKQYSQLTTGEELELINTEKWLRHE